MKAAPRVPGVRRSGFDPLAIDRDRSVFVNGPFDSEFRPRLDAIVFAILSCGYVPRSALEWDGQSKSRMQRIQDSLAGSRYSVHDLSRCTGEGEHNLARMNMPFELGLAAAAAERKRRRDPRHDWLLLVPTQHPYQHFLSDLAGHDPETYNGTPEDAARAVLKWFDPLMDADTALDPAQVVSVLPIFIEQARQLRQAYGDRTLWLRLLKLGYETARALV